MTQLPAHLTVYNTINVGLRVVIFLDREEVDVFEAHTEEGWIIRPKLDEKGHFCVGSDGEVIRERLTGIVTAVVE